MKLTEALAERARGGEDSGGDSKACDVGYLNCARRVATERDMTLPQRTLAWSLFWLTLAPVRAQRVPPDQALVVSDFSTLTSKDLISPFPIHIVNPLFPSKAKKKDAQGEIVLRGVIATDGSVRDVSVVSGNSSLSGVAIEAVRHWQYLPAIQNGEPIASNAIT